MRSRISRRSRKTNERDGPKLVALEDPDREVAPPGTNLLDDDEGTGTPTLNTSQL